MSPIRDLYPKNIDPLSLSERDRRMIGEEAKGELPLPEIITKPNTENPRVMSEMERRYSDWRRELHLRALNKNLAGLHPEFSSYDLQVAELSPYLFEETTDVSKVGDGLHLVNTRYIALNREKGSEREGEFKYLMGGRYFYEKEGALQVVLAGKDEELPKWETEVKGGLHIGRDELEKINATLNERNRLLLPDKLSRPQVLQSRKIEQLWLNRSNERYFDVLTLGHPSTGVPLLLSRLGDNGSNGLVYVVRYDNGEYGLQVTYRPLLSRLVIETPRGFSDREESDFDELEQETGLELEASNIKFKQQMLNDPRMEYSQPTLYVLDLPKERRMKFDVTKQTKDKGYEDLLHGRMSAEEAMSLIDKGDIVDAFTISSLVTAWLRFGDIELNDQYKLIDLSVVMEERFLPQLAEKRLVIPRGGIDQGVKISELAPNTGNARIFYQIRIGSTDILQSKSEKHAVNPKRKLVKVPLLEVVDKLKEHEFDIVTASAITQVLIKRGILIPKEIKGS